MNRITSLLLRAQVKRLGTIVGVWAHPDDEAYLSAGLMAAAVDNGQRVVCVTATKGEHGTSDPVAWPPSRLARLRETEVAASLAVLGVEEHHFLGYEDGTCADQHPREPVDRLCEIIDTVGADTVVTFGPDGMTGHPDHIQVGEWATTAALVSLSQPRVLHATMTTGWADQFAALNDAHGVFGPAGPPRTPTRELALQLQLEDHLLDRKMAALRAQASQTTSLIEAVGERDYRGWWATEAFTEMAYPPHRDQRDSGRRREADLLARTDRPLQPALHGTA